MIPLSSPSEHRYFDSLAHRWKGSVPRADKNPWVDYYMTRWHQLNGLDRYIAREVVWC